VFFHKPFSLDSDQWIFEQKKSSTFLTKLIFMLCTLILRSVLPSSNLSFFAFVEMAAIKQQKLFNKYQGLLLLFWENTVLVFLLRPSKWQRQGQVTQLTEEAEGNINGWVENGGRKVNGGSSEFDFSNCFKNGTQGRMRDI